MPTDNDYILNQIKEAADVLNHVNELGEAAYNQAEGILSNLKAFIHDPKTWDEITAFEKKLYMEFTAKINAAQKELKEYNPFTGWREGAAFYMKLRQWKATELISYWDRLAKEHKEL